MKKTYYTPGPSELYFTYADHIRNALREGVGSISHRSKHFQDIYSSTCLNLRELMNIPDDWHILFTSSTNETWERILMNLVEKNSFHLVNGAFSKKFYEFSALLGREAKSAVAEFGTCVDPRTVDIPPSELIAVTLNETSTGAYQPLSDLEYLRNRHPESIIAVDAVSAVPYPKIDYNNIDTLYFSVQKAFGLPAGLGVWLVNPKCVEKNISLETRGQITGTYNRLSKMIEMAKKNQNTLTPNVVGIYTLGKVAEDMNTKGIEAIRRETEYKSALVYSTINSLDYLDEFVKKELYQSKTTIVSEYSIDGTDSSHLINFLNEKGMVVGNGYGNYKGKHIRIANFPTHSKEQMERLVDGLIEFKG